MGLLEERREEDVLCSKTTCIYVILETMAQGCIGRDTVEIQQDPLPPKPTRTRTHGGIIFCRIKEGRHFRKTCSGSGIAVYVAALGYELPHSTLQPLPIPARLGRGGEGEQCARGETRGGCIGQAPKRHMQLETLLSPGPIGSGGWAEWRIVTLRGDASRLGICHSPDSQPPRCPSPSREDETGKQPASTCMGCWGYSSGQLSAYWGSASH